MFGSTEPVDDDSHKNTQEDYNITRAASMLPGMRDLETWPISRRCCGFLGPSFGTKVGDVVFNFDPEEAALGWFFCQTT